MNCRRVEHLLSNYLEDRLSEREADTVAAHLRGCPGCRRLRGEILAVGAELREPVAPLPPPELRRRVVERWMTERAAPAPNQQCGFLALSPRPEGARRASPWLPAAPAVVGAVLLAVLTIGLIRWQSERAVRPPTGQIAAQPRVAPTLPGPRLSQPRMVSLIGTPFTAPPRAAPPSVATFVGDARPSAPPVRASDFLSLDGDPARDTPRSLPPPTGPWDAIEARVRRVVPVRDDFIRIPFPRLASTSDRQIAAAVESYKREAAIVDARLSHVVSVQQKATALSDLCERLRADTGIQLSAGPSVADEKVTIFCEKTPLREVMRQLSRPFGYAWLRSNKEGGEYRYELAQDLKSLLLEEELRNRDRHASLLALAKEMERYRPYLDLSPEEALARSKTASPNEKKRLEQFAIDGWGPIQLYFRLSPQQWATLRAGQKLTFSADPEPGELPLPRDLERGVLQSQPYRRLLRREDGGLDLRYAPDNDSPNSLPLTAFPEIHAKVQVEMPEQELGQYSFAGNPWFFGYGLITGGGPGPWAVGRSPSFLEPDNAAVNTKLARDPALQPRVSVQPLAHDPDLPVGDGAGQKPGPASDRKVTSAEVLEALHRASGLPIVADYYTRLHNPMAVSRHNRPLFEALNRISDAMHLRWHKETGAWLQFRSTSFYYDRLKEVPNRLLIRWVASRRQHGYLTLDDLIEIAQLSDTQLDAADMAEGAKEYWGLKEWDLVRSNPRAAVIRQHLRALAGFTPAQHQEMLSAMGLPFAKMSLAQQQQFIASAFDFGTPLQSLDELSGATLRVNYTQPGWFEWRPPGNWWWRYVVALERWKRAPLLQVRERTREAALQALRRVDPQIREAILQALHRSDPGADTASLDETAQIVPTELKLAIIYIPDSANKRNIRVFWGEGGDSSVTTW
jgi:hypothetical protein